MPENDSATRSSWRLPFFTIWSGQALSLLGSQLVQFALIWWLTSTTGSATVLATATLVGMLPFVFIGPFAGACVDRWNRRRTMMWADGLIALATLFLAVLHILGLMRPWHIYVIMFIRSAAGGFHWPAMNASTSLMVPKEQLGRVAGMNQTLQGVVNIVTPPLGALLLSVIPLHGILSIDIATAVIAILPLFFIHVPQPEPSPSAEPTPSSALGGVWQDFKAGLHYVRSWRALVMIVCVATCVNFLITPAMSLLPLLVTRHFGGAALELGWLESASGIGVLVGGVTLSVWGGFRRRTLTMGMGLAVMALSVLVMGFIPGTAFALALAAWFVTGASIPLMDGPFFALLQERVEPGMQGRVFTLVLSLGHGLAPLSMALAGPIADLVGIQAWYIAGGLVSLVLSLAVLLTPSLRHLEESSSTPQAGTPKASVQVALEVEAGQ